MADHWSEEENCDEAKSATISFIVIPSGTGAPTKKSSA